MTSRDFCIWLKGHLDIESAGNNRFTMYPSQVECVRQKLELVFADVQSKGVEWYVPIKPLSSGDPGHE